MVVPYAEFAQSYMHQPKIVFLSFFITYFFCAMWIFRYFDIFPLESQARFSIYLDIFSR